MEKERLKVDKQNIYKAIEKIVGNGVVECEEIDVTTQKIVDTVWPVIDYLNQQSDSKSGASKINTEWWIKMAKVAREKYTAEAFKSYYIDVEMFCLKKSNS